jgi:hypothetical protein
MTDEEKEKLDKSGICPKCLIPYDVPYYSRDADGVINGGRRCGKVQGAETTFKEIGINI